MYITAAPSRNLAKEFSGFAGLLVGVKRQQKCTLSLSVVHLKGRAGIVFSWREIVNLKTEPAGSKWVYTQRPEGPHDSGRFMFERRSRSGF